jgi:hypothetical protein
MLTVLASGWAPTSLEALANYAQLIGLAALIFAVVSLRHSATQIKQTARATQGQLALAIDDAFAEHLDARTEVSQADKWKETRPALDADDRRKFRRYLAVFERIGLLVKDELMTIETVEALYGERFAMLLSRDPIRKLVDGRQYARGKFSKPDAWVGLVWLWWRMYMRWVPAETKKQLEDDHKRMLTKDERSRLGVSPQQELTIHQRELPTPPLLTLPRKLKRR